MEKSGQSGSAEDLGSMGFEVLLPSEPIFTPEQIQGLIQQNQKERRLTIPCAEASTHEATTTTSTAPPPPAATASIVNISDFQPGGQFTENVVETISMLSLDAVEQRLKLFLQTELKQMKEDIIKSLGQHSSTPSVAHAAAPQPLIQRGGQSNELVKLSAMFIETPEEMDAFEANLSDPEFVNTCVSIHI